MKKEIFEKNEYVVKKMRGSVKFEDENVVIGGIKE